MFKKTLITMILSAGLFLCGPGRVCAEVVIKVRALNPLDTAETAVINYPLPEEVTIENVLQKKITYSMDHSEDEEPPKNSFQISFDEEKKIYFIDDEVRLLPKEVVTLEVHVQDVWKIDQSQIDQLRSEVGGLVDEWESNLPQDVEDEDILAKQQETKEFALMMRGEILSGLDKILERQNESRIIDVGVERHISGYVENMDELRQIQQDIVLLANLIQFEDQEPAETEGDEVSESPESGVSEQEDTEPVADPLLYDSSEDAMTDEI